MFYQVKAFVEHGRLSCYQLSYSTAQWMIADPAIEIMLLILPSENLRLTAVWGGYMLQGMIDAEVWIHDTQQDQFQSEGVFIIWAQPDLNALISRCAALSTQQTRGKYISIETGRIME